MTAWDGDAYQKRFDDLAASGMDVHGEANFVMRLAPRTVLDAGCGTGRVAIELARRGVRVVGVDVDASMLATARAQDPSITWIEHDLTTFELGEQFDVVLLAGNVPLFTPSGTQSALVAHCARHVGPEGVLVAGFQLDRGYDVDAYDSDCEAVNCILRARFSTWNGDPFMVRSDYAVSVHALATRDAL
jgi:2-polyprenyl-3-methyl-5-hydroxy-6-metoxy-1,4-benzoquinol methylase